VKRLAAIHFMDVSADPCGETEIANADVDKAATGLFALNGHGAATSRQ